MAEDKRQTIRKAAISAIARMGYHDATTDVIAREANVAVGTLYNYFKSKEEILSHIFEVECEKRLGYFHRVNADSSLDALEKVEEILRFHFDEMAKNPEVAAILVREKNLPLVCPHTGPGRFRGLSAVLIDILRAGIEAGTLRPHNPEIIASCLMGGVEAVISGFVLNGSSQDGMEEASGEIVRLLRNGIEKSLGR